MWLLFPGFFGFGVIEKFIYEIFVIVNRFRFLNRKEKRGNKCGKLVFLEARDRKSVV